MAYKQFYLLPIVTIGNNRDFKYMRTRQNLTGFPNYSGMDYGIEAQGLMVFTAELVDHNLLTANADVFQFPVDLTLSVAANELQGLRDELNSRGFASQYITSPEPYSGVVRNIAKNCLVNQRFQGLFQTSILDGGALTDKLSDIPQAKRDEINIVSDEYKVARNNALPLEAHLTSLLESIVKKPMIGGVEL